MHKLLETTQHIYSFVVSLRINAQNILGKILFSFSFFQFDSVWLNADVLSGPIDAPAIPVLADQFLSLCQQYFPGAVLSIGWTTYLLPISDTVSGQYGWQHVREMADVIQCRGSKNYSPKFTFPVRGLFASKSIHQLQWLLSLVPNSTLTVWTGKYDPLGVEDLLRIRKAFPKDRVFYDLPGRIGELFQLKKNTVDVSSLDWTLDSGRWITFTKGQIKRNCSSVTYVRDDNILFGKRLRTAVLRKDAITLGEDNNLKMTGRVKFFDTTGLHADRRKTGCQELKIIFADVSLFSKNSLTDSESFDLTASDGEIIWSAINSSAAYTFQHEYHEGEASCRLFKLDTVEDKTFEAWTVPCDDMLDGESPETMAKNGVPEVSSRKRLVMPKGPFLLGFVSAGDEHVALYDLKIEGSGDFPTTSSSSLAKAGLLPTLVSSLCLLLLLF